MTATLGALYKSARNAHHSGSAHSPSLSLAENDLENTKNQLETAKKEVQKPFIQEEELKTKLARLDELNILLNMDKRENEIVGGEPDEGEVPNTRKEKTYER